ncbi:MAG: alcohol dehydrogenase catalytic domain-containing protein, partial [bacterium]|nr:alcohol dehydrogenase catalytic domain-containing protein [bacterium]
MLAIHLEENRVSLIERPIPVPPPGEALVRVRRAGVCATDLELIRGYMGFRGILGHEFAGVVEGPENHPLAGKRVVGEINCGCGTCTVCRSGRERHCPDRSVLGIL